eukprot:TRINITY_DN35700_c0_g1_i1.p1 TRINITY_DN35700_c0_g1~~TRINITY_DN35700_c0_g1_i1.p1  ORF type:complete len:537 (+),score=103.56 TRINITY_DN35700_c0_g1_i1:78-1688(+)
MWSASNYVSSQLAVASGFSQSAGHVTSQPSRGPLLRYASRAPGVVHQKVHSKIPSENFYVVHSMVMAGIAWPVVKRNRKWRSLRARRLFAAARGAGTDLPTDEEMRQSLNARLPANERIAREMGTKTEDTLRKAEEKIAEFGSEFGVDIDKASRDEEELARVLPWLPEDGPSFALCLAGPLAEASPSEASIIDALKRRLPKVPFKVLDLLELTACEAEELASQLGKDSLSIAVFSPSETPQQEEAAAGFRALLEKLPDSARRIVLVTDSRSQASTLEKILTVAVRERSPNAAPLRSSIVRASVVPGLEDDSLDGPGQVYAKLPATVRDAAWGLRSTLIGGLNSAAIFADMADGNSQDSDESSKGLASSEALAAVLDFALRRGVDVPELRIVGGAEADWDEVMLPLVGPELLRMPVESGRRCRAWVRGWAEFNYCRGASQGGAAMKKAGLRTPVECRTTLHGVCIKFLPSGREPGVNFAGLLEGGLEVIVDDATTDRSARLRVRRCSYGWRTAPRESSERAIISRLRRDWEATLKFR